MSAVENKQEFSLDMLICNCFEFPVYFNESKLKKIIMEYFKMESNWLRFSPVSPFSNYQIN